MAAITSITPSSSGSFSSTRTTLTADDTITYNAKKKQLLVLSNDTAGSLTATIDGSTSTTVTKPGLGTVDVSAGKAIVVAAGASVSVLLSSISAYCSGVVHITGGTGLKAQLFDL